VLYVRYSSGSVGSAGVQPGGGLLIQLEPVGGITVVQVSQPMKHPSLNQRLQPGATAF